MERSRSVPLDDNEHNNALQDARRDPRVPIDEQVTIEFDVARLVGPGQNVSAQGVYFTTHGSLRVQVRIGRSDRVVPGELVRLENMGDGRIGIAVRFLPDPEEGADRPAGPDAPADRAPRADP